MGGVGGLLHAKGRGDYARNGKNGEGGLFDS